MKIRLKPADSDSGSPFLTRIRSVVSELMKLLGIETFTTARTTVSGVVRHSADRVSFFEGVPPELKDAVRAYEDPLAGILFLSGILSYGAELTDVEVSDLVKLWGTVAAQESTDGGVVCTPDSGTRTDFRTDENDYRIADVYEIVSDMLPMEGRDYVLNPEIRKNGAVGFSPVAHTEIGKLWLDYLSENLPRAVKERFEKHGEPEYKQTDA